tara:strand:+ start:2158 stop:3318 length:1161 start_codon:yes stop_codon:yes gene_type:complete
MSRKKICIVTGTRAEYGLLKWLIDAIKNSKDLKLQIIVTGMHLSSEFGFTLKEIENDGYKIDKNVEMLLSSDTKSSISKSTGLGIIGFSDAYNDLNPDMVIVLGDRFEILAASIAAYFSGIPIGHIHGGETTEGAFDEAIRHSITKMSWWHFVASKEYKKRVIQLGEHPRRVFDVGGLGVDSIRNLKLLSKKDLIKNKGIKFKKKNLLITFHPETLDEVSSNEGIKILLKVLEELKDVYLIFTMPNADSSGKHIKSMIDKFVRTYPDKSIAFTSLGSLHYLSLLQFIDGVVGNSSSGLLEAPTFMIGTVNLGDRQKGRLKASSVIDAKLSESSIRIALTKLFNKRFKNNLSKTVNPYGGGYAVDKILNVLESQSLPKNIKKKFYDL